MYLVSEDSFLLLNNLNKYLKKNLRILEIGAGSGIISQKAKKLGAEVLCVDIDKKVVKQLIKKHLNARVSNLFSNIKKTENFNLIVFNPPYLPEHKYDKQKDTSGGKKGYELSLKFLKQAKKHLDKDGKILLLLSSFSNLLEFKQKIKKLNIKIKTIAKKKLFFEQLHLFEISFK